MTCSFHSPVRFVMQLVGQHPGPAGTSLAGLSLYSVEAYCQIPGVKKMPKAQRTDLLFTHKVWRG